MPLSCWMKSANAEDPLVPVPVWFFFCFGFFL
jgi:hypothetical protein